jgi:hypothetical protein
LKLVTFNDYAEYRTVQVAANNLKFRSIWVEDAELLRIADYVRRHQPDAKRGICHGVRNGYEVRRLRALLRGVDLIGTDIADSAANLPHCRTWDMHEVDPAWVGAMDVMYSNSWDHSYNPGLLFKRWSRCLSPEGRLFLSYTEWHSERGVSVTSKVDVFGCSCDELLRVVLRWFTVDDILDITPSRSWRTWRQRVAHLRAGRVGRAIRPSRRSLVFVLRRQQSAAASTMPLPIELTGMSALRRE